MTACCPFCGASLLPRSRFCPACGKALGRTGVTSAPSAQTRPLAAPIPIEAGLPNGRRIHINGEALSLRELINVVESGVRWWQHKLASTDIVTREQAARSIEELSQILHSLSKQLALGRETVQITTRLPTMRTYQVGCSVCGR